MNRKKEFLIALYNALSSTLASHVHVSPHLPEISDVHATYVWFTVTNAQEQGLGDVTDIYFDINILTDTLNSAMDLERDIYAVLHRQTLSLSTSTNIYIQVLTSAYFTDEIAGVKKIRYVISCVGRVAE